MFKGAGCQPAPYDSCPGHCPGLVDHLARGAHSGIDLEAPAALLVDGHQQLSASCSKPSAALSRLDFVEQFRVCIARMRALQAPG